MSPPSQSCLLPAGRPSNGLMGLVVGYALVSLLPSGVRMKANPCSIRSDCCSSHSVHGLWPHLVGGSGAESHEMRNLCSLGDKMYLWVPSPVPASAERTQGSGKKFSPAQDPSCLHQGGAAALWADEHPLSCVPAKEARSLPELLFAPFPDAGGAIWALLAKAGRPQEDITSLAWESNPTTGAHPGSAGAGVCLSQPGTAGVSCVASLLPWMEGDMIFRNTHVHLGYPGFPVQGRNTSCHCQFAQL